MTEIDHPLKNSDSELEVGIPANTTKRKIIAMERHVTIDMTQDIPVIRDTVIIEREPSQIHYVSFIFQLFLISIICQFIYFIWNKFHPKSCKIACLALLAIFPVFLSTFVIFFWGIYLLLVAMNCKNRFNLLNFLCTLFNFLYVIILVTQVFLLGAFIFNYSVYIPFLTFLISIYFAVLSREIVYYVKDQKFVITKLVEDNCALCNKALNKDKVMSLSCKCTFHVNCIKGWAKIGNKELCPFCNGKVISPMMNKWDKQIEAFLSMLDYAKGGIYLMFMVVFYFRYSD